MQAVPSRFVLFGLVSLALLVTSMQFSMVSVAFPDINEDLDAELRWVGWVIIIYSLAQGVSMPIAGKLSDELGRRTVFMGGLTLFSLASLGCAVAPNVWVLIVARAVQGLAGGSMLPSAYGVVGDAFDESQRSRAIGMISSVFPIGSILGPNIGGLIVDHVGWRWTFMLNVPLGMAVVLLALFLMPRGARQGGSHIDGRGAALLALAVTTLVFGMTELGQRERSPSVLLVVGSVALSVALLSLFVRHESRAREPIIDLALLRGREFAFTNVLNFFYGMVVFGLFSFIPLYAESVYEMTPSESGALLTPRALGMIGASMLASMLLPRTGYRRPIFVGLWIMAAVQIVMSLGLRDPGIGGFHPGEFVYLGALVAVTGIAFGTAGPAANNAAIELAPHRIAAITGLRGMFRSIGGTIGTSVIVLVTARAETEAEGLEQAFVGLGVMALLTSFLVLGIPDAVGRGSKPVARPAPPLAPEVGGAAGPGPGE